MADRDLSPASDLSILSNNDVHPFAPKGATSHVSSRVSSTASPPTSTPPTSLGDEASTLSELAKMEHTSDIQDDVSTPVAPSGTPAPTHSAQEVPNIEGRRSARNSAKGIPTYNLQILSGSAIHTPTKYLERHYKKVLHGSLESLIKASPTTSPKRRSLRRRPESADDSDPAEQQLAAETVQAAQRRTSSRAFDLRRFATQNLTGVGEAFAQTFSGGKSLVQNALKRSASDSRLRSSTRTARQRTVRDAKWDDSSEDDLEAEEDEEEEEEEEKKVFFKPKSKQWMKQGLYVGQERDFDARLSESQNRARRISRKSAAKEKRVLPLPMFAGDRMLSGDVTFQYRNFRLPYDVYHPLPRKVKVDGWVKLHKNRFIGEASALWKRDKPDESQCYCSPEDGCGETCHNRIMAYECDDFNCPLSPGQCANRPFAQLKKRAKGNGYDYGVEVMETSDKGYGVRAMRTFEPHQIIVEYAGEIITQSECERRMKQVYKKDKCYYLMSFDNKMIIDATRGTIARFVNHSCEPNCEMIKWTVSGEPRMALFAGRRGIMTGEELTYDYNFDPFSSKNIQECRCGTESCRGVLGPKPKKPLSEEKSVTSSLIAGAKRKLQEVFGSGRASESAQSSPKKRILGSMARTKARNALAASAAARDQAAKEAAAHAAQRASREDRAMNRSKPMTFTKRTAALRRRAVRSSQAKLKASRRTTVTIQRRITKPGALKPVKRMTHSTLRRPGATPKANKPMRQTRATRTPIRSPTPETEDDSPNITPASLRSASKKLIQTKLPFKALGLSIESSSNEPPSKEWTPMNISESDEVNVAKTYTASKLRGKRGSTPAPRGLRKTGAGVVRTSKRVGASRGFYMTKN